MIESIYEEEPQEGIGTDGGLWWIYAGVGSVAGILSVLSYMSYAVHSNSTAAVVNLVLATVLVLSAIVNLVFRGWRLLLAAVLVLFFIASSVTVAVVNWGQIFEGDSREIDVDGTCYTLLDDQRAYLDLGESNSCDGRVWVNEEAIQGIVSGEIESEGDLYRLSGTSGGIEYDEGYLLIPGEGAVYVDVKVDDSIRSIPLVYTEDQVFVYYEGEDTEITF